MARFIAKVFQLGSGNNYIIILVCDSVIHIDLIFNDNTSGIYSHTECTGSGYTITINSTTYDENNPAGVETILNTNNCDSVLTIDLDFLPDASGSFEHTDCANEGYEIIINGTPYNQSNPTGTEIFQAANDCDSVVYVELTFLPVTQTPLEHNGCIGDGYFVIINGTVYDELNPTGVETLPNYIGCDSVILIDLNFSDTYTDEVTHDGCIGDGYTVVVGGTTYDENNPTGTETLPGNPGCDTVVTIDLQFNTEITHEENHNRCVDDGFSITVNNVLYDENNPTGTETITSVSGCDSVVTIDLFFADTIRRIENHHHCEGDGFSITVNNVVYDENNPTGTETMTSVTGCDSVVEVNLNFVVRNHSRRKPQSLRG